MKATLLRRACRTGLVVVVATALASLGVSAPAAGESKEVRLAQQFGLLYLPMHVVVGEKLIEKHAKQAGLGDVRVSMVALGGGAASNQALLSGNVDLVAAGIGPLLTIWDKTRGTDDVKAALALNRMPLKLISNDANVKNVEDYLKVTDHKIATPSVSSIQAVTLRMAADRLWGEPGKLDPLLVNMKHPDAVAAVLSGGQTVKSHFATLPFSFTELKSGKAHLVLSSYDVLGGPHSVNGLYTTSKWKNANPKLFQAVVDAFKEAIDYINADPPRAAAYFIKFTKSKLNAEDVRAMVVDKNEVEYSITPLGTMAYATFMHKIGAIKTLPSSWKDYFFESVHSLPGS